MSELPDVEGFRRVLAGHAVNRPIERVDVLDAGVLHGVSARRLRSTLRRRRFGHPRRHGKWLIAPVDAGGGPIVLLHFGMTGSLCWAETGTDRHRHDRVVLGFADGELRYRDMRKLHGRVPPRKSWLTGRRDEPSGSCPRCATTLSHGRVGGCGTAWCPHCQRR